MRGVYLYRITVVVGLALLVGTGVGCLFYEKVYLYGAFNEIQGRHRLELTEKDYKGLKKHQQELANLEKRFNTPLTMTTGAATLGLGLVVVGLTGVRRKKEDEE